MRIITIANQKGGVGKTTTVWMMAYTLAERKHQRVLVIDTDDQLNLTMSCSGKIDYKNIYNLLEGESAKACIQQLESFDIIAGSSFLPTENMKLSAEPGSEYVLSERLAEIAGEYDYVLIDTSPALSPVTVSAIACSDEIIIPVQADLFSLQSLQALFRSIQSIQKRINPNLKIGGILLTRFQGRTKISKALKETLALESERMNARLFEQTIREGVAVREAQLQRSSPWKYAPKAKAFLDYESFVEEWIGG